MASTTSEAGFSKVASPRRSCAFEKIRTNKLFKRNFAHNDVSSWQSSKQVRQHEGTSEKHRCFSVEKSSVKMYRCSERRKHEARNLASKHEMRCLYAEPTVPLSQRYCVPLLDNVHDCPKPETEQERRRNANGVGDQICHPSSFRFGLLCTDGIGRFEQFALQLVQGYRSFAFGEPLQHRCCHRYNQGVEQFVNLFHVARTGPQD